MTLDEYAAAAMQTKTYGPLESKSYSIAGIASEAGEVNGKWAKYIRDNSDFEILRNDIKKETGDCLWMVAALCDAFGWTLEEVAQTNLDKLADRKARGVLGGSGDNR